MSQNKDNSIDALVRNVGSIDELVRQAEACLKDKIPTQIEASMSEVSFWLLERDIANVVEQHKQIKDVSEIRPCSKIDIELAVKLLKITYRLTIKTAVTKDGVFELRHAELTGMQYQYPEDAISSIWEDLKRFMRENSVGIAGLLLSLFNTALTLMRLGQQVPGVKP